MVAARRLDFDVVVIGGGMVGLAFAALAAEDERLASWRIAIVEPAAPRPPRDGEVDLRVSALSRASQRILQVAAAWPALAGHACPYSEMVAWDAASRPDARDAMHFSAAETGEPDLGHIVENLRVQWALLESPRLKGATELRAGLEALALEEDAARLTLSDGRQLSCGLVVGADGGPSRTRELCGIGRAGWAYGQSAVVAHLRCAQAHRHTAWQRFLPDGPIAFLPLVDGRVSLVWTVTPAAATELLAVDPAGFSRRVTEASGRVLGDVELDSARAAFPLALWHARDYVKPRLALVGDAAHTIHPLAGQGVNLGFLDSAALVEVLAESVAADGEPFGVRTLRRYERWRRSENALMLATTDTLNRLFGERSVPVAAARRLGMAMVGNQPLVRRALVTRALGLAGDLPGIVTRPGHAA
ncbi:MAG: FAD-dependent monooxygenase [Steroidobacteraceae bacterium]